MSYEEYLNWNPEGLLTEWKDGEVFITMPAKREHQRVVGLLNVLISMFVSLRQLGIVSLAPFEVRLSPAGPSREPDLFFVAHGNTGQLTRDRFEGGPDLAIEVVSDDSVGRDRNIKLDEYRTAGVREYWIIDPRPRRLHSTFYRLAEGRYHEIRPDAGGVVRSEVLPGFWVQVSWLWEDPSPSPLTLLATILGRPISIGGGQDLLPLTFE